MIDAILTKPRSMNNKLIVEVYTKEGLRATVSQGFAMIEQKVRLKGLRILMDTVLADGTVILKGSMAHIKEELLHTQPWAQKSYTCDTLDSSFMVIDASNVDFISPPSGDVA